MVKGGSNTVLPDNNAGMIAAANASGQASMARTQAGVDIARTQAMTQMFGILEGSNVARQAIFAQSSMHGDTLDAKLELAKGQAYLAARAQKDEHTENMKGLKNDEKALDVQLAESKTPDLSAVLT